ncbi:MAG: hypothetical protein IJI22_01650 [Bacilli bacterium]|nr:hypothetical protein [Bacilli bacterium]
MYILVNKKKIEIKELTSFWDKFKGLKFNLKTIDYGLLFKNKKFITTNFHCQRIDIIITDELNRIIAIYEDVASEKYIINIKAKNTYFLPLKTAENFRINDILKIKK